tara:strand:- start:8343 stop:9353 length:1011 start_codon:yes stop_codon:yes gene_type:complete
MKYIKNITIPLFFSILWLIIIDPSNFTFYALQNKKIIFPNLICYDLPACFRILSFDILNIVTFIFAKFLLLSKLEYNPIFFSYYFLATSSLIYIFKNIKFLFLDNKTYFISLIYIFIVLYYFELPLLRIYDYFVLVYFIYILKNFSILSKNFFSFHSIFLLLIGTLIFEYAGLMYGTSIVIYNFLNNKETLKSQTMHLLLFLIPLMVLITLYFYLISNENYFWVFKGEKNINIVWKTYGQHNSNTHIIKSLIKYSYLFFILFLVSINQFKWKIKLFLNRINTKENIWLFAMILSFFCAVSVGKFVSGFNSEWQRQFIPYLFFITLFGNNIYKSVKN